MADVLGTGRLKSVGKISKAVFRFQIVNRHSIQQTLLVRSKLVVYKLRVVLVAYSPKAILWSALTSQAGCIFSEKTYNQVAHSTLITAL